MRRATLLICAVISLCFPSGAVAKGLTSVRACGPDACVLIGDFSLAGQIVTVAEDVDAPAHAPYYRLDITQDTGGEMQTFSDLFVPSSGLVAGNVGSARALLWYQPAGRATQDLRAAVRELAPYPAPAAWPVAVETPPAVPADRSSGTDWMLAAALVVLALAAVALRASRPRVRRPKTA